ncbi:MAG: bifunctional heptose 7-phosphate kinase/heptose 1-phosphate adenyltransferase [Aureispira sp.]
MREKILENSFNTLNVLVVGDVILDHYLIGKVERISPEAPVPVVLHEEERYCLGGAANVALNIQALGANPHLLSITGQDEGHHQMINLLEESNIKKHYLFSDPTRRTTLKTRVMARQQQLVRYDYENTHDIDEVLQQKIVEKVEQIFLEESIDALILQDYNKGLLTAFLIEKLIALAQKRNITTLADPKKTNFLSYKGIDWFKPNLREINEGLGLSINERTPSVATLKQATEKVQQHLGNSHTLITLGPKGLYATASEKAIWMPTKERAIADVCGAGDTVISVVAVAVAAQLQWETILKLANIGGGQVCERVGVVAVNKQRLLSEYNEE